MSSLTSDIPVAENPGLLDVDEVLGIPFLAFQKPPAATPPLALVPLVEPT